MAPEKQSDAQLTLSESTQSPSSAQPPTIQTIRDISISLDFYDDIFSDFDPRPFSDRELSKDFLAELATRHMETRKGQIEVRFFIPALERDGKIEATIKKRLREHFESELKIFSEEVQRGQRRGTLYVGIGFVLLFAEILLGMYVPDLFLQKAFGILLVPAGWYGMFTGIEKLIETEDRLRPKREMAKKFTKCNYIFISGDRE
ncbi:Uncharacterised protein [Candidatus Anstonella stagnisolia]|nr:Uncharacterised protein [Candidatus Anstonella stagnisolia]